MAAKQWQQAAFMCVIALWISAPTTFAQVLEPDALQRKQEDQQRARTMTRDLLGGVLDVQLRQLDENGLSDQEIYRDIKLMRQNLNQLVETEMSNVVNLLAEAQRLPSDKREAVFVEARQQIRAVVRQLSVERQNLLKRLKIAELAEQVRRLIRHQMVVQTATKGLTTESQTRQEALTLKAIEDQRDVKELFLHLVDTMVDMKSWSGTLAMAAADGLRILKAAEVGKHFDLAGRQLQALKYDAAHGEQELVIKGLKDLLKVIERTQGALNSENMKSQDRVRALMERQKQLREETKSLIDVQKPSAEMVERQAELQKQIASLAESIRDNQKAESHIQQAEAAALDAAANLLDNKLEQAYADQGRVLGNLSAMELALKDQARQQSKDKSANELADAVKALQEARSSLKEAQQKQLQAVANAEQNAQSAIPPTKDAADLTQRAMDKLDLPAAIENAMADAVHASHEATKNLESAKPEKATAVEEKALKKAGDALERAVATIDAALLDTQRQESAVKIGELARAAEVLERAAAEERAIAKDARAQSDQSDSASASEISKGLAERQQDVKAIATKAAEALAQTAPNASKTASDAAEKAGQSENALQAIADQKSADLKQSAQQAAQAATESSQKLAEAAKEIRNEIVATAKDLTQRTTTQAKQLSDARATVEAAVDGISSQDKVAQLEAARNQLGKAMQEQLRAQGKPDAASAMDLANQIAAAIDAQDAAQAAAAAADAGFGSELKATTSQEEVAEKSQAAADSAAKRPQSQSTKSQSKPDELVRVLNDAHHSAAQAAKQTLDGNLAEAQASRQAATTALKQAMEMARAEAVAAENASPSGSPDKQAQENAVAGARQSQATAVKASTEAGSDLVPAVMATQSAENMLAANSGEASQAQAKATQELKDAGKKLDAAISKAANEQASHLASQSMESTNLADQIASVDPAAADAIDVAANAARMGSDAMESPRQMAEAATTAGLALEHAAATLGAKEQEVRRDQAIAESVANLAETQQSAAEVIAEQSDVLEGMSASDESTPNPQQSAAEKLNEAQQQFADSQRATGQGAVALSGQTEVANPPLREALELASKLPAADFGTGLTPESMLTEGQLPPSEAELADGKPASDKAASEEALAESAGDTSDSAERQSGKPASSKSNALGTGFIPNSPQLTAEMMAGSKAQQAAQKIRDQMAKSEKQPNGPKPSADQTNDSDKGKTIDSEHSDSTKLTKKDGSATTNQKVKDGAIDKQPEGTDAAAKSSNKAREKEEAITARQVKEEAWFAKLPPELRKSIRAGMAQKPPRAYEERLKNYFQSVD
jgi:hypothetical protein